MNYIEENQIKINDSPKYFYSTGSFRHNESSTVSTSSWIWCEKASIVILQPSQSIIWAQKDQWWVALNQEIIPTFPHSVTSGIEWYASVWWKPIKTSPENYFPAFWMTFSDQISNFNLVVSEQDFHVSTTRFLASEWSDRWKNYRGPKTSVSWPGISRNLSDSQ